MNKRKQELIKKANEVVDIARNMIINELTEEEKSEINIANGSYTAIDFLYEKHPELEDLLDDIFDNDEVFGDRPKYEEVNEILDAFFDEVAFELLPDNFDPDYYMPDEK